MQLFDRGPEKPLENVAKRWLMSVQHHSPRKFFDNQNLDKICKIFTFYVKKTCLKWQIFVRCYVRLFFIFHSNSSMLLLKQITDSIFSKEESVQNGLAQIKMVPSFQSLDFMQLAFNCHRSEPFSAQRLERSEFLEASSRSPGATLVTSLFPFLHSNLTLEKYDSKFLQRICNNLPFLRC